MIHIIEASENRHDTELEGRKCFFDGSHEGYYIGCDEYDNLFVKFEGKEIIAKNIYIRS